MTDKLKEPHLLLASSNVYRLLRNARPQLTRKTQQNIIAELRRNVRALFALGEEHYQFASAIARTNWRQRISRLYYGAYNVKRALQLNEDGSFSTDSSDHKRINELPTSLPGQATFANRLRTLREDRNLADYNHDATSGELVITPDDAETLVRDFIDAVRAYLAAKGVTV